jgi:hypothetical protein
MLIPRKTLKYDLRAWGNWLSPGFCVYVLSDVLVLAVVLKLN